MNNRDTFAACALSGLLANADRYGGLQLIAETAFRVADRMAALSTDSEEATFSDWSRFHNIMNKHGLHPGRTGDDLLDILDEALTTYSREPGKV